LAAGGNKSAMRMTVRSLSFLALVPALVVRAQQPELVEHVRNGGFEFVEKEPDTYDMINRAEGWGNVTIGYSELFSKSAPGKTVGIPVNDYGKMDPQEGDHYGGFFAWKDDEKRNFEEGEDPFVAGWSSYSEYIITDLVKPLQEEREYEVSFWIALSDNSDRAVSGIGAYCSLEKLSEQHRRFLRQKPQVSVDSIIETKGKWMQVKGTFEADGGEQYIIIGTYPAADFMTKRMVEGLDNKYAYYYVDGISVKLLPKAVPEQAPKAAPPAPVVAPAAEPER
jgi:OmpA-OmpF porin, OOP family